MNRHYVRKSFAGLFMGLASLAAAAQTLDFEVGDIAFLFDGSTFEQSGFTLTQVGNFGTVDTSAQFESSTIGPSGNASRFYSALNDTSVQLTNSAGSLFGLTGFDAGFIAPPLLDEGLSAGRVVVSAIGSGGLAINRSWNFGLSGADGSFAFLTFGSATDFAAFGSIRSAVFSACLYVGDACTNPGQNLAQFAVDNVHVLVPVPEPETYALMLLGLAALAYRRRQTR